MNRLEIAAGFMQALISRPEKLETPDGVADKAIEYSDALLRVIQRKPDPNQRGS